MLFYESRKKKVCLKYDAVTHKWTKKRMGVIHNETCLIQGTLVFPFQIERIRDRDGDLGSFQ